MYNVILMTKVECGLEEFEVGWFTDNNEYYVCM